MLKGYMFERLNAKRLQLSKATYLKGYMTKGYNFQRLHDKRLHFPKATLLNSHPGTLDGLTLEPRVVGS